MTERGWMAGGLLALGLAAGALGPMSRETSRIGAATCLLLLTAGWIVSGASAGARPTARIRLAAAGLICALLAAWSPSEGGPVLSCALFLSLGPLWCAPSRPAPDSMRALAIGACVLAAWTLATDRSGWAWRLVDQISRDLTGSLGSLAGSSAVLGASVGGLSIVVLVSSSLAALMLMRRGLERAITVVALCWLGLIAIAAWAAGVPLLLRGFLSMSEWSGGAQGSMPVRGYPASVAVYLPLALFCALGAALLTLGVRPRRLPPLAGDSALGASARSQLVLGCTAVVLSLLACWPVDWLTDDPASIRVTFRDQGLVNWDVPSIERRGLEQAGMFGMLPRYLANTGMRVRMDVEAFRDETLGATDVLVVINPTQEIGAEDLGRVRRFVEAGGGLLVLGDHTDLNGIMAPLNSLLGSLGMEVQFDSAFTPRHWRNDAGFRPGPMTRELDDANSRFQQSTGGSLRLGAGADPVALARWGFSDAGDRNNKENAFLGDYIYQAAEPLGDLPVVAIARHGRGRVIAFGDTSAFQNNSLPQSWPFLMRVFQTAASRQSAAGTLAAAVGLWGLVALIIGVALNSRGSRTAGVLGGALAGLLIAAPIIRAAEPQLAPSADHVALVDTAHFNDVSLDLWEARALSGLNLNLARHGYLPLVMRQWSPEWLRSARLLVTIAPRQRFSAGEIADVKTWTDAGGELLLSVGWEEKAGSEPLLQMAGFDVAPVPLGPVPVLRKIADNELFRRLQMEPHFAKAWPILGVDPSRDTVLYAADKDVIAARRRMGQGGVTLVADSRFLLNKTLEEEGAVWEGNISFLRALLKPGSVEHATGGAP